MHRPIEHDENILKSMKKLNKSIQYRHRIRLMAHLYTDVPEWSTVEGVVQWPTGIQSILVTKLFKRRVHSDEGRDDDVVQRLQQYVLYALAEPHLIGKGSNGGWEEGRRSWIRIEVPQSGGGQQDEWNVQVVGENSAARVESLDDQYIVRWVLQSDNSQARSLE